MNVLHKRLLLLNNATVNGNLGFDNVCKEKQVSIGWNQETGTFKMKYEVINETTQSWRQSEEMHKYPVEPYVKDQPKNVANKWEILAAFFARYNIRPIWVWGYFSAGTLNYTSGQWSGLMGLIQRDEVDYVVTTLLQTYERSKVGSYSPGDMYSPQYFYTRFPRELPPTWNLIGLFTKGYKSQSLQFKYIKKCLL